MNSELKCAVCGKPCNMFNYGANCCNACKMFFRRVKMGGKNRPKPCENPEKCIKADRKCRFCRYQDCLQAGMCIRSLEKHSDKYFELSDLIANLSKLNIQRKHRFLNIQTVGAPSIEEIVIDGQLQCYPRRQNQKFELSDWIFNATISAVEFFKQFKFVSELDAKDRKILLKSIYTNFNLLSCAFCSYKSNRDYMCFPNGCDVVPYTSQRISEVLENNIRKRLIGKLVELKMTAEEYMLLTGVLFCNSTVSGLSNTAKSHLSTHQGVYSSTLLQLCLINFQSTGPSRYWDLLSVCDAINANNQEVHNHGTLFQLYEPDAKVNVKKTLFELC